MPTNDSLRHAIEISAVGQPGQLMETVRQRAADNTANVTALRERWKYTLARRYYEALAAYAATSAQTKSPAIVCKSLPKEASWQPIEATSTAPYLIQLMTTADYWQRYPLADLVTQLPNNGWQLQLEQSPCEPIHLVLQPGAGYLVIELAKQVQATVHISYANETAFGCHWIATNLASGAKLNQSLLRHNTQTAVPTPTPNWLLLRADLHADAQLESHVQSFATGRFRLETHIALTEPGATSRLTAASMSPKQAEFDHQVVVEHQAPYCRSEQRVHNVAAGNSKNTFNGRIHIHTGAKGSDAQLQNRNLALAPGAQINTKPELEIYNDDVSCSHGATIGQLDDQALFYLTSRGIPEHEARYLLLRAFISDCIQGPNATEANKAADALLRMQQSK